MTVLGLPLVLANLNRIGAQMVAAQSAGLADAGGKIRDAWVDNIESEGIVDTGNYRDSIQVAMDGDAAVVYTDVEYARFLEFGTSDTPPHPAAEQAADEHQDDALDAVADAVRRVVR